MAEWLRTERKARGRKAYWWWFDPRCSRKSMKKPSGRGDRVRLIVAE